MSLQIIIYICCCLRDFNLISLKCLLNLRYIADISSTYLVLLKYSLIKLLSVSSDSAVYDVTVTHIETTELQNILQYVILLLQIITSDLQILNELQKKTTTIIIFYQNYCNTYIIFILNVQTVTMYFNEKFPLIIQYTNNICNNLILKILLQLTFTVSAVSEKITE